MKERYTKPVLTIEKFSMSQTIASNCGAAHTSQWGGPTQATKSSCGWEDSAGAVYWLESNTNCTNKAYDDSDIQGVCYNSPSNSVSIFNS